MQVLGVEEVRRGSRHAAYCGAGAGLGWQRVAAEALETTIQHNIGVHVLEALEASLSHVRCAVLSLNTLNCLQRVQVITVHHVVRDDQVREIPATDKLDPQRIKLLKDCSRAKRGAAVGSSRPGLVAPEGPLRTINTAHRAAGWRGCNKKLQATNRVGHGAVTIDTLRQTILERVFRVHNAALKQVDNGFLT